MKILSIETLATIVAACFSILATTGPALATSCWSPSPAEHARQADMIFYGEALTGADGPKDDKKRVVQFKVLRAYKGVSGDTVSITYTNDHGALLGWGFANNQPTMIFADRLSAATEHTNSGFVGYCSMIPYHARPNLHAIYWDVLVPMKK